MTNRHKEFFVGDDGSVLKLDCGDNCTVCKFSKYHQAIYLKWVYFMSYRLYVNKAIYKNKEYR